MTPPRIRVIRAPRSRRPRRRALAAVLIGVLVSAAAGLVAARAADETPQPAPFTLAIVRQDGILTPFVSWTGKRYENNWPTPGKDVDTPIALEHVPKGWWGKPGPTLAWEVWQADGSHAETRATAPTWFPAHCQQGLGLRTSLDVRQPLPPMRVQPYPKLGVAASRRLDLQPIERLDPAGRLAGIVLESLVDVVNVDEDEQARRFLLDGWQHPYDPAERHRIALRLEALYRAPAGPKGVYVHYFEAVKRYPIRPSPKAQPAAAADDQSCELITVTAGWFIGRDDDVTVSANMWRTRMTSCDFESVDVMLPLASVVLNKQPVWIAQLSGWGRENYALIDALTTDRAKKLIWQTSGGFCAK